MAFDTIAALFGSLLQRHPLSSVVVLLNFGLRSVLLLPLADLTFVGFFLVELGEDKVKNFVVPTSWTALDTFLDVLCVFLLALLNQN